MHEGRRRAFGRVRRSWPQIVAGSAIGAVLAWWLFRDTDWRSVAETFAGVDVHWILLSQALVWTSYFVRARRWAVIARAARPIRFRTLFGAAQVGFLANVSLPMRLGEGVRAVYLARRARLPVSTSVVLVALDRVSDMIGLLTLALVALLAFPSGRGVELPPGILHPTGGVALSGSVLVPLTAAGVALVVAGLAILVILHARRSAWQTFVSGWIGALPAWLEERLRRAGQGFADGMGIFDNSRSMARAVLWSILGWGLMALSLGSILRAFSIDFAWWVPVAMQAMLALFATVPIVPGLIGQFHLAVIVSLLISVPETGLAGARAVAIATHLLALFPVVALGVYCLVFDRTEPPPPPSA